MDRRRPTAIAETSMNPVRCFSGAGPAALGQGQTGPGTSGADTAFVAVPAVSGALAAAPPLALETFLQQLTAVTAGSSANSSTVNCSPIPEVGHGIRV